MNNKLQIFQYNGSNVTFDKGEGVMVNATEMAKPFGKRPVDWLNLQSAKDFLEALANVRNPNIYGNQIVTRQGSPEYGGGTWFHEDIAIEFARWLSPAFAIWCNDRIKELLTTGMVSLSLPQDYLSALKALVKAEGEKLVAQARLAEMQPKADYCDTILRSRDSMVVSQIAKDYGMPAKKFNTLLFDLGVQYKVNGQWLLYAEHAGRGYVDSKTASFTHSNGDPGSSLLTVWTQKGRLFLYNLLKQRDVRPLCEQEGHSVLPAPANVPATSHE